MYFPFVLSLSKHLCEAFRIVIRFISPAKEIRYEIDQDRDGR